jgi:cholesterol transport system auxiliary component
MTWTRMACALFLLLCLGGCAPLTGGADPLRIVAPDLTVETESTWPAADWTLVVQRPVADKTRGSSRVVVRSDHARLAFYPGIAWLDELPEMVQALLLQAFTDTGRVAGVVRPGSAKARYALATEIRRFEAVDAGGGDLEVELEVQASLLELRSGGMVESRVFTARTPVAPDGVDALTDGFERALDTLIGDLIGWTLNTAPAASEAATEAAG